MKNNKFLTKKSLTCFKQALALAGLTLSFSVNAAVAAYTNKALFDSAAGSTTLETFDSGSCCASQTTISTLNLGGIQPGVTYSLKDPFSGQYSFIFNGGGYGFSSSGQWLHSFRISGTSALNIEFESPVSAFGFDTVNSYMGEGFTANINFSNGSTSVQNVSDMPNRTLVFYGFVSDMGIDSVEIQGTSSQYNFAIDNFQFGGAPAAVPVPAAAWLFGSALAGLGVLRRKK